MSLLFCSVLIVVLMCVITHFVHTSTVQEEFPSYECTMRSIIGMYVHIPLFYSSAYKVRYGTSTVMSPGITSAITSIVISSFVVLGFSSSSTLFLVTILTVQRSHFLSFSCFNTNASYYTDVIINF